MTMTMTRNYQHIPATYPDDEGFGTYTPTHRRASLPAAQRTGTNRAVPTAARRGEREDYQDNDEASTCTTDDLEDEPRTSRQLMVSPTGRGTKNTQGTSQPQSARSPWKTLCIGIGIPVGIYTLLFVIVAGWILLINTLQYGPTHTAYTQATIKGQASTIVTSNINNTIYVTIINQKNGTSHTYTGPMLDPNAWGGDTNGIVATAEIEQGQAAPTITVHLVGDMNYFHLFFVRPQMTFLLVPDTQSGYKVVASS